MCTNIGYQHTANIKIKSAKNKEVQRMNKKMCRDMNSNCRYVNSNCRYVNSNYIETLEELHYMLRYTSKLTSINDRDPYSTPDGE